MKSTEQCDWRRDSWQRKTGGATGAAGRPNTAATSIDSEGNRGSASKEIAVVSRVEKETDRRSQSQTIFGCHHRHRRRGIHRNIQRRQSNRGFEVALRDCASSLEQTRAENAAEYFHFFHSAERIRRGGS